MPAAVDQDRTACEGQAPGRTRLVTTFYDLITALHESIEPAEEDLVTAAVVHLLHAGHVKCLERPLRGVGRSRGAGAPCRGYFLDTQEFLRQRASRETRLLPGEKHR